MKVSGPTSGSSEGVNLRSRELSGTKSVRGVGSTISTAKHHDGRIQGAALIIVLSFLIIITGLVVAFISSVTNDATSTAAAVNAVTTRSLADTTIQLTIAQIRDGTAGFDHKPDGSLDTSVMMGWASQPGAIRAFPADISNTVTYKLYSAPEMRSSNNTAPSNDLPANGWWDKTAIYTDLNSPVVVVKQQGSGSIIETNYPIMDPSLAMTNPTTGASNSSNYVDGFTINTFAPTLKGSQNPAAMPVCWLYKLKDGTLIAPDTNSTTTATFGNSKVKPTKTNPIVGRIAFWTDDETCKLNINTASEGVPWTPPSFVSLEDSAAQSYAPAGNEYNRFHGHPFSVSLSPVLWSFFGFPSPASLIWANPQNNAGAGNLVFGDPMPVLPSFVATQTNSPTNYINALFGNSNVTGGLLPRTASATNGSIFGSFQTTATNNRVTFTPQSTLKTDRLYSSVDELAFRATNSDQGAAMDRVYNSVNLGPRTISQLRFFLTAVSRAPEVNIFDQPRISLWPLPDTNNVNTNNPYAAAIFRNGQPSSYWSSLDTMIARDETIGTNAYYFTRYDATSQTNDLSPNHTPRNVVLYNYLLTLLQTPVPGYADSFQNRFASNSNSKAAGLRISSELATMIFDYIRGGINLCDSYGSSNSPANGQDATDPATRFAFAYTRPPTNKVSDTTPSDVDLPGTGQVIPIKITTNGVTTRGAGRFPILKSATLVFSAVAADQPPLYVSNAVTRAPIRLPYYPFSYSVNPLYPYPVLINTNWIASSLSNFWEMPKSASAYIMNGSSTTHTQRTYIDSTNADSGGNLIFNRFPSWYPPAEGFFALKAPAGINNIKNQTNYSINLASQYVYQLGGSGFVQRTNTYLVGSLSGLTNAHGITVTHPGLVYGGDLDVNPVTGTNAFDLYNLYFTQTADWTADTNGGSGPLVGTINGAFDQPYQMNVTNVGGKLATNFLTNSYTLKMPNTNSPLFPKLYETVMVPSLVLDFGIVNPGFTPYHPNFKVRVIGLDSFTVDGAPMYGPTSHVLGQLYTNIYSGSGMNPYGPDFGIGTTLGAVNLSNNYAGGQLQTSRCWPFVGQAVKAYKYAQSDHGTIFDFGGGSLTVQLLTPDADYANPQPSQILQTISVPFPSTKFPTPKLPPFNGVKVQMLNGMLDYGDRAPIFMMGTNDLTNSQGSPTNVQLSFWPPKAPVNVILPKYLFPSNSLSQLNPFTELGHNPVTNPSYNLGWLFMPELYQISNTIDRAGMEAMGYKGYVGYEQWSTANTLRSVEITYGDWRLPAMVETATNPTTPAQIIDNTIGKGYDIQDKSALYSPHLKYFTYGRGSGDAGTSHNLGTNFYFRSAHTLRGISQFWAYGNVGGEHYVTPSAFFTGLNDAFYQGDSATYGSSFVGMIYNPHAGNDSPEREMAHRLSTTNTSFYNDYPEALSTVNFPNAYKLGYITVSSDPQAVFQNVWSHGGDFNNPAGGLVPDGPYLTKPDEGSTGFATNSSEGNLNAYMSDVPPWGSVGRARFSPNKQVPSSGVLGSIPIDFDPYYPSITNAWRTLSFSPNPNGTNHSSLNKLPPDYMIMDLFNMPVVQPYPITEGLSTAGRVNLNYQIAPFSYIKRDSALRGVLKSEVITAVCDSDGYNYKDISTSTNATGDHLISPATTLDTSVNNYSYHYPIHLDATLKQFDAKFATNGFFRSGAEICSVWLYPGVAPARNKPLNPSIAITNYTADNTSISNWWYNGPGTTRKGITGDNMREAPYVGIYPNVTTKSNTYEVHYRVQTLKQTPMAHGADNFATWIDPATPQGVSDKVIGELRGSAIVERFIDPSATNIPDIATELSKQGPGAMTNPACSLENFYHFRVVNSRQFAP